MCSYSMCTYVFVYFVVHAFGLSVVASLKSISTLSLILLLKTRYFVSDPVGCALLGS